MRRKKQEKTQAIEPMPDPMPVETEEPRPAGVAEPTVERASPAPEAEPEPEGQLDETIPGGRYRNADGKLVNADGEPIKGAKKTE